MTVKYRYPKLKINHPLHSFTNSLRFADYYRAIYNYEFKLLSKNQKSVFTRIVANRKCCICNRTEPFVSFKRKSHAIPVAFGNKWFYTQEECNDCNRKYGNIFENELANMFSAHRLIGKVPKRKGFPKIRIPKRESFMRVTNNGIAVSIENSEREFAFKELNHATISLSVPMPPYYPIRAIKSIAHTLWLILDDHRRVQYKGILKWIKGDVMVMPMHYYIGLVPGPGRDVLSYTIWEKVINDKRLADLIIKFDFSNTFLIWELPDIESNTYLPGILPEISISMYPPFEPQCHFHTVNSDTQLKPMRMSFTFQHEGKKETIYHKVDNKVETVSELKNHKLTEECIYPSVPHLVKLVASRGNEKSEINYTYVTFKETKNGCLKFIITGGHLAGKIEGEITKSKELQMAIEAKYDKLPLAIAKNNFLFFQYINSGCSLDMIALMENRPAIHFETISNPGKLNNDIMFIFESLEVINKEFNVDMRYSQEFTDKEVQDICYLANGILYGEYRLVINNFQIEIDDSDLNKITPMLQSEKNTLRIHHGGKFIIGGLMLDTGGLSIYAKNPQLSTTQKMNNGRTIINIAADLIIFSFDKYLKNNESNKELE